MENLEATLLTALRAARSERGLSQRELGQRVGLAQSHISKIESGAVDIRLSTLVELSRALGLEPVLIPRRVLPALRALEQEITRPRMVDADSDGAVARPAYRLDADGDDG